MILTTAGREYLGALIDKASIARVRRQMVCVDETLKQLIAETRVPIPAKSGRIVRYDYEYQRNGTANLFMRFGPLEG